MVLVPEVATAEVRTPSEAAMRDDVRTVGIEPLFVRGVSDAV